MLHLQSSRNDIEAVSVRAGCTFTGFDDSSLNGESMTVRAGNKDRLVKCGKGAVSGTFH